MKVPVPNYKFRAENFQEQLIEPLYRLCPQVLYWMLWFKYMFKSSWTVLQEGNPIRIPRYELRQEHPLGDAEHNWFSMQSALKAQAR